MDVIYNLEINTYRPYKKPNDNLTYTNTSSNHPPQIIKYLNQTISERLYRNSSSAEIFGQSKSDEEEALKRCDFSMLENFLCVFHGSVQLLSVSLDVS